ncbi:ATP-binding protein [Methanogenium organophilum]|uniref:ATP-binding protein n=1 Tax=Methanogenium organophilum TaxID=2199 RepID=A0A9X9T8R0_METOG|nr:ATP-binding protein [Methanogenium organophilum]WAI01691.1 ATP-binding protein [Methanogenium organophilum]
MKTIAVMSGKGGTGKTMVAAGFSVFSDEKLLLADCDVDAANLSLLLETTDTQCRPYMGLECAVIDKKRCVGCGICEVYCRFNAIGQGDDGIYHVNPLKCEGCGVCSIVCREDAIEIIERQSGEVCHSESPYGHLFHAELFPGSGTSGRLVFEVKQDALGDNTHAPAFLIDGPPGIGCPVISAISGVDAVVLVTEPGISALHDLRRLVTICRQFGVQMFLVLNKADLDEERAEDVRKYCAGEGIEILGTIPFDPTVIEAARRGKSVAGMETPAAVSLKEAWKRLTDAMEISQ